MTKFEKPAVEFKYDGFRCITGHTGIYTNSHGLKPVKDIKIGDMVLTHKGRFKKVIAINKRKKDKGERLFRFQSFMGNEFRISEGHEVLCKRKNKIVWLPSEQVTNEDVLAFPLPKLHTDEMPYKMTLEDAGYKKEIILDSKFFRFLGYWIGDGFTNEYHNTERVGLIFNSKHKTLMREYKKIIQEVFDIKEISEYKYKNNAISMYWRDKPLRVWLSKNFRIEWKGKTIPDWFININQSNFKAFLQGWRESDGTDSHGTIKITTQERKLASLAQIIGLMHSIPLGLRRFNVKLPRKNYKKEYYMIIIPKSDRNAVCSDGYAFYKILKKEEIKRPDPRVSLYNLQIEDDESYCTNNVTLHNCQIHKDGSEISVFSRRMENVTKQFPDIVALARKYINCKQCIVEGEAVAIKEGRPQPFQLLSKRIRRKYDIEKMVREIPVQINLFDLLYLDGVSYIDEPLTERWASLKKIVTQDKSFRSADHLETTDIDDAAEFYEAALAASQEGVIVKNMEARYQPGKRVGFWLKVKEILEPLDLVVVGAEWGEGKKAMWLSSVILAAWKGNKLVATGRMASGFTEDQLEQLTKTLKPLIIKEEGKVVAVKPVVVIEIGYEEIQRSPKYESGYALRFPRLLRLRTEEKKPEDADTVTTIEKLFKMQRGRK